MPKYDQDFKLLCIRLSDESKPLPRVPGVQEVTLKRYVSNWRLLLGQPDENKQLAFKQFGNSVNVQVLKEIFSRLTKQKERKSVNGSGLRFPFVNGCIRVRGTHNRSYNIFLSAKT